MIRLVVFLSRCKLFRFLISGGTAACITIGTVYIMTHVYAYHYLVASTTGFLLAGTTNFLMQKFWTFRERSMRGVHRQTLYFFLIQGVNLFLNAALMVYFVDYVKVWPVVGQFLAAGILAVESFILYSLIFTKRDAAQAESMNISVGPRDGVGNRAKPERTDANY